MYQDGGPRYTEFNPGDYIVEPWNAVSSLLIALPAIIWFFRLRGKYGEYAFLVYCIPLLFANGIGSFFFHAFRNSSFFLWLDVLPAAILTLSVSLYFWYRLTRNWWLVTTFGIGIIPLRMVFYNFFSGHTATNISYFISGTLIFLPVLIYQWQNNWKHSRSIVLSVVFLTVALLFREMDSWPKQPFTFGTHFLWHGFTGLGAYFLAQYLFLIRSVDLKKISSN